MADTTIFMGHEAKIKINGTAFAVRRSRVRIVADEHETGDTESAAFKRQKGGRSQIEAELEFYEDSSFNYHTAPLNLNEGGNINLHIYPRGLLLPPYHCPNFVLGHVEITVDINNPTQGTISGKSDGPYYRPGDTDPSP